ncbi:hypothetical protein M0805_000127 [Coniferiporia weirii]|nr:hypothetical protein M0805_000127 [Coniferiporia weirii]
MDSTELERLNVLLDHDIEMREKIKDSVNDFEKKTRSVAGALSKIHATPSEGISALLDVIRPMLKDCSESIFSIADLIPEGEYWRWSNMWTNSLRSAVFAAVLVEYLDSGNLLSQTGVACVLRLEEENTKLFLQAEDYLHGLISMVNELSRWAVNAVTLGDFERPIRISIFVKDIFAGFSLLNLKNDLLRRRFDSLKYDIKKIEEVVYDVSLRRLADPKGISAPA